MMAAQPKIITGFIKHQGDLFYRLLGDKTNPNLLLLIHGFTASSAGWQSLMYYLYQRGYTTFAVDLRGHGYSDKNTDDKNIYRVESISEDVHYMLHAVFGSDKIKYSILGHSAGGLVCLQYIKDYAVEVDKLILCSTSPKITDSLDWHLGISKEVTMGFLKLFTKPDEFYDLTDVIVTEDCSNQDIERLKSAMRAVSAQANREALKLILFVNRSVDFRDLLPQIENETMIIFGDQDRLFDVRTGEYMRDHIPNAFLQLLKGKNHVCYLTASTRYNRYVYEFLNDELDICDVPETLTVPSTKK
jgi:pimeloyl-ACP methyl ester carboxylesterase